MMVWNTGIRAEVGNKRHTSTWKKIIKLKYLCRVRLIRRDGPGAGYSVFQYPVKTYEQDENEINYCKFG